MLPTLVYRRLWNPAWLEIWKGAFKYHCLQFQPGWFLPTPCCVSDLFGSGCSSHLCPWPISYLKWPLAVFPKVQSSMYHCHKFCLLSVLFSNFEKICPFKSLYLPKAAGLRCYLKKEANLCMTSNHIYVILDCVLIVGCVWPHLKTISSLRTGTMALVSLLPTALT